MVLLLPSLLLLLGYHCDTARSLSDSVCLHDYSLPRVWVLSFRLLLSSKVSDLNHPNPAHKQLKIVNDTGPPSKFGKLALGCPGQIQICTAHRFAYSVTFSSFRLSQIFVFASLLLVSVFIQCKTRARTNAVSWDYSPLLQGRCPCRFVLRAQKITAQQSWQKSAP